MLPIPFAALEPDLIEIASPFAIPSRQPWLLVHHDLRRLPSIKLVQKWIVSTFARL
ncbi:hypothetical protein [Erythrobacter mangrovi]|uniref:LysR substrate-binding domain-containing protein n=1 Tax=Erythrobacter mangrovi TaxID=2739433 RepID=A0A7D4BM11_9SPHN|nr:hypothetical protein [Erythrobacter mangrovi]QKG69884.1 hypothetical protein HQR01_00020 [Erythrobacter mangrovi]